VAGIENPGDAVSGVLALVEGADDVDSHGREATRW
jgi:hypothetical protein